MFSTITTGSVHGIDSMLMQVEVDIAKTMPAFDMVGMLSGEVKEARERVRVALRNSGIPLPPVHITVNIAPANVKKEGTAYSNWDFSIFRSYSGRVCTRNLHYRRTGVKRRNKAGKRDPSYCAGSKEKRNAGVHPS